MMTIAAGHSQCASILLADRRYREADSRYDLALSAARQVEDKELVGKILQHQGALADNQGQVERASHIYQQALKYFQEAGERRSVMLTYNLLGVTEAKAGRLAEARAWFEGSRELALELQDQNCLGQAAQNIGIACRDEGDAARERGEEVTARQHFEEALRFGNESLQIKQRYSSKPDEASAWSLLAQIHLRLGDLASAEHHAHEARKVRESLDLKEVYKDYDNLSEIARARGNLDAAAEWAKKRDNLLHELERRGGGGIGLTVQIFKALQALTRACAKAGFEDGGFGPDGEEELARLAELPVPFSDYGAFLRQLAQGQLPPIPNGLPDELREWVEGLVQEIRKAPQ
jgi:tetratricopeptide (TPR) repeat protein